MQYSIKKKTYDLIVKNLARSLKLGDGLIFSGNCIHPVFFNNSEDTLAVNGTTTIKSFLPFALDEGVTLVSVMNINDILTMLKSKTGMKSIYVVVDENSIRMNTDGDEILIATTNKRFNGVSMAKTYSDFDTFSDLVNMDDDNKVKLSKTLTSEELLGIRDSKPVSLVSEYGKVRISKNLFPLTGPMPKNKPVTKLTADWCIREVDMHDANTNNVIKDYVLSLHVIYNDLEAIHLYSVIPF